MKDMFVASTLFWQTSLQDMTRQIKTDGLTGLEMWGQQFFYQNYDIEEYKTLAEAYGLRTLVHSCSWDLNLASINESIRQASVGQVIASLQLAKAIGAEEVTVHPGHLTLAGITDRSCQILHHSLEEISEAAASMSLAVSLEIMEKIKKEFVTTAAAMQAVTGELFPKFSYTVDIAHCDSLSEARQLLTFMPGVSKIHISNRRGAVYHTPLGEGDYDFFLLGETLHGDYNQIMNDEMLHSVTNYEWYKGLYSSFNCMNMFEINHSLLRQFGPENWTLYKGKHLLSFVDNHDVTRVASILNNANHLPLIYTLAFGMPGIPCVYYGSEWGATGRKEDGDPALRVSFDTPVWNDLTTFISKLAVAKKSSNALNYGSFSSIVLTNEQCIFLRQYNDERVLVAINASEQPYFASFNIGTDTCTDLISGSEIKLNNGMELPGYSSFILQPFS